MTIQEKIQKDLTEAMKAKDALRMDVLRGMKTGIKNKEIEKKHSLGESEALQVLNSLVKQRNESIEQFTKGGRRDLVDREESELKILESYLPAAVNEEEIRAAVAQVIAELQASSLKDLGRVMKGAIARFAGSRVDGKLINEIVRSQLEGAGK
jgi:uncharacterized protein YqeY